MIIKRPWTLLHVLTPLYFQINYLLLIVFLFYYGHLHIAKPHHYLYYYPRSPSISSKFFDNIQPPNINFSSFHSNQYSFGTFFLFIYTPYMSNIKIKGLESTKWMLEMFCNSHPYLLETYQNSKDQDYYLRYHPLPNIVWGKYQLRFSNLLTIISGYMIGVVDHYTH